MSSRSTASVNRATRSLRLTKVRRARFKHQKAEMWAEFRATGKLSSSYPRVKERRIYQYAHRTRRISFRRDHAAFRRTVVRRQLGDAVVRRRRSAAQRAHSIANLRMRRRRM